MASLRSVIDLQTFLTCILWDTSPSYRTIDVRKCWINSKNLARIRAVADYSYETLESERALFGGR